MKLTSTMEKPHVENVTQCCHGCLINNEEHISLHIYNLQNETWKSIFGIESITVCYMCRKMIQNAEMFIQNVQSNLLILENFYDKMEALEEVRKQSQHITDFKHSYLNTIEFSGNTSDTTENVCVHSHGRSWIQTKKVDNIKLELKLEEEDELDHLDGEFLNEYDFCETHIKQEDSIEKLPKKEIGTLPKKEKDDEDLNLLYLKKTLKKTKEKRRKKLSKDEKNCVNNVEDIPKLKIVNITKEQCLEERDKILASQLYVNCVFKCENCAKGFINQESFEKHIEKHSEEMGEFECDICKQRMSSDEKLQRHRRYHERRYKCPSCSYTRITKMAVRDHYLMAHTSECPQYYCQHCPKIFKREGALRRHVAYCHTHKSRVTCAYCNKTYANKETLKAHIMLRHTKMDSAGFLSKRHVCEECGASFLNPSRLKNHSVKHSGIKNFYCVECNKSFKSDAALQHHLKTAGPHIKYLELPYPCQHCDKRFAVRRDKERHTNRVHLNIRPHQCDLCDKAYVNGWSLTEHKKLRHEGYKRPLKYPCTMCDKVFTRNQILKSHLRTHTGERPYQCTQCGAQFGQASVLGTHIKLVHLRQSRGNRLKK